MILLYFCAMGYRYWVLVTFIVFSFLYLKKGEIYLLLVNYCYNILNLVGIQTSNYPLIRGLSFLNSKSSYRKHRFQLDISCNMSGGWLQTTLLLVRYQQQHSLRFDWGSGWLVILILSCNSQSSCISQIYVLEFLYSYFSYLCIS